MSVEPKKLGRRTFLNYAIAVVVTGVIVGAGTYFAVPKGVTTVTAPGTTTTVERTVTTTVTGTPTTTSTTTSVAHYIVPNATKPSTTISLFGWGYRPDIVTENLTLFNQQLNENAAFEIVSGDYAAIMASKFASGIKVSICYANPFNGPTWYTKGWAYDLNEVIAEHFGSDLVKQIKSELYPSVLNGWTTTDGAWLALPYFVSARGNILVNGDITEKAGITEYPTSWWDLYEKTEKIKAKGVCDTPLLPHWFKEWYGTCWAFLFETMNRSKSKDGKDCLFDENFNPVFGPDTEAGKVLKDWNTLWQKGLVPKGILTMNEADFLAAFGTGNFAYNPGQTYDLKTYNDPATSKFAGKCTLAPAKEYPWGILDMGGYILTHPKNDPDFKRAVQLELWYGYKDVNGKLFVATKWASETALNSGYKAVLEDASIIDAYKKWMPSMEELEKEKKILEVVPFPHIWKSPRYESWQTKANDILPQAIMGQRDPTDVINELYEYARQLKSSS
jgi:ABC-type glycerol-3-phosphate transport system substrate-binding protein